ncbi:hypothetical protein JTB14_004838 [Gonioctena quinquepunctata]|nr:hypothetical protein JTB14_004838 [Gonioctena quinquepunctata]
MFDDIMQKIVAESNKYAKKNGIDLELNVKEPKSFNGFLFPTINEAIVVNRSEFFSYKNNQGKNLSIDESMVSFEGRCSLKQYMPKKNIKRGFMVWVIAYANTGTLANELIGTYSSRQRRTSSTAPVAKLSKKSGISLNSSTTMRKADVGLHSPVKGTIRRCAYCSSKPKPVGSTTIRKECNVALCIKYFELFHGGQLP